MTLPLIPYCLDVRHFPFVCILPMSAPVNADSLYRTEFRNLLTGYVSGTKGLAVVASLGEHNMLNATDQEFCRGILDQFESKNHKNHDEWFGVSKAGDCEIGDTLRELCAPGIGEDTPLIWTEIPASFASPLIAVCVRLSRLTQIGKESETSLSSVTKELDRIFTKEQG